MAAGEEIIKAGLEIARGDSVAAKAAANFYHEVLQWTDSQFRGNLPNAFSRLYPHLTANEQSDLVRAAQKLIPSLQEGGMQPAKFFEPGFNARSFLSTNAFLNRMGVDNVAGAASMTKIMGSDATGFLTGLKGISHQDAMSVFPNPAITNTDGLSQYLMANFPSDKLHLPMLRDVARKWTDIPPEVRAQTLPDAAFLARTGIQKSEFIASGEKPLISYDGQRLMSQPNVSVTARATIRRFPAGQVMVGRDGSELQIGVVTVDPAFHHLKLTGHMLDAVIANSPGAETASLFVGVGNTPARIAYTRAGFGVDPVRSNALTLSMIKRIGRTLTP